MIVTLLSSLIYFCTFQTSQDVAEQTDHALNGLDRDLCDVKVAWESLCAKSAEHEAAIAELTGCEVSLQSTLDQKEARVQELESLLQSRDLGNTLTNKSVLNTVMGLEILKSDLERTKDDYSNTCNEVSLRVGGVGMEGGRG